MSLVSQTSPRGRNAGLRYGLIAAAVTLAIVVVSVTPMAGLILRAARSAQPHAPDLVLFASLSLAIKLHILGAMGALVLGAVLMTARKGRTFHRTAGWIWVCLVSVVAGSSIFITEINHGNWSLLHILTGWVLIALPLAVVAARRHNVARHRKAMMGMFYGGFFFNMFIAFLPGRTMWEMFL